MLIDGRGPRSFDCSSDIEKVHTEVRLRSGSRTEGSEEPTIVLGSDPSTPTSQYAVYFGSGFILI
jgi:hypothetical protein